MKYLRAIALLVVTLGPAAFAESRQHSPSAHMRPQLFHDRAPRVHSRTATEKHG